VGLLSPAGRTGIIPRSPKFAVISSPRLARSQGRSCAYLPPSRTHSFTGKKPHLDRLYYRGRSALAVPWFQEGN